MQGHTVAVDILRDGEPHTQSKKGILRLRLRMTTCGRLPGQATSSQRMCGREQ